MYRHRRSKVIDRSTEQGQEQGVRFVIPLHRINSFDTRSWASFATVVTFNLGSDDKSESEDGHGQPLSTWRTHDTPVDADSQFALPVPPRPSSPDGTSPETITIAIIQGIHANGLADAIEAAKARRAAKATTQEIEDQVIVDFGELAFAEQVEVVSSNDGTKLKGKDVKADARRYFALPHDEDVWCEFLRPYLAKSHANPGAILDFFAIDTRASIGKVTSSSGYLVISPRFICFWSKSLVSDKKYRFP
jgi:hypothetical protein